MTFSEALKDLLDAVRDKNWDLFEKYLDPHGPLIAVLPPNRILQGFDAFVDSQKSYFKNKSGKFSYEILQIIEAPTLGIGSVRATYQDQKKGKAFKLTLFISSTMKLSKGKWILVLDQNTVLNKE